MNKINYVEGEIIEEVVRVHESGKENILIPHVCNNAGVMGAGVAFRLANVWPIVLSSNYRRICLASPIKALGKVDFVSFGRINIANMIAQDGFPSSANPTPLNLMALVECMKTTAIFAMKNNLAIIAPKFGSLRAGGNWDQIEAMIRDYWLANNLSVTIVVYKES